MLQDNLINYFLDTASYHLCKVSSLPICHLRLPPSFRRLYETDQRALTWLCNWHETLQANVLNSERQHQKNPG